MNLLPSNRKFELFLVCSVASCMLLFAQTEDLSQNDFSDYCKKSDAYLLYSFTDVTYTKSWSNYKRYVTIDNKMVVNTNSGIDKHAYINLSKQAANNIYTFDVKTLKANGKVVSLDSTKVFDKSTIKKNGIVDYPIPGVEPGDTIHTSYTYTQYLKLRELYDFVDLYSDVPSFNTEYSIRSNPELLVRYKGYNDFPEPQVVTNDSLIYCVFKMEEVKDLKENQHTCLPCELPHMYYSMEKEDSEPVSWKQVYNYEFNFITQPIAFDRENSAFYNRWKRKVIGAAKDSSAVHRFKLLHEDLMFNHAMEDLDSEELIKSSGYFLKEQRFNPMSIRRIYRRILEDLEIPYWAVFARSNRAGKMDPYYIRKGEYDHVFFAFNDDAGNMRLLYPHESHYKYHINEIPTSLFNSDAVIVRPHNQGKVKRKDKFIGMDLEVAEVDSVDVNTVKLPGPTSRNNYVRQIFYSDVDLEEQRTPLKYRFSVSGGLYTELKSFIEMLEQDEDAKQYYDALEEYEGEEDLVTIDTINRVKFKNTNPFSYTMNAEGQLNDVVSFINEGFLSISLDRLLQHSQIASDEPSIDLNYYLDYGFNDYTMAIFNFPRNVEVLDFESYNVQETNALGTYTFKLKVVDDRKVTLESEYKINQEMIGKDDYDLLRKINGSVDEMRKRRLVVKLK